MKVKILKDASFALDGKFVVELKKDEVKKFTDVQCARLIEIGFAESASDSDTTTQESPDQKEPVEVEAAWSDKRKESPKKRGRRSKRG